MHLKNPENVFVKTQNLYYLRPVNAHSVHEWMHHFNQVSTSFFSTVYFETWIVVARFLVFNFWHWMWIVMIVYVVLFLSSFCLFICLFVRELKQRIWFTNTHTHWIYKLKPLPTKRHRQLCARWIYTILITYQSNDFYLILHLIEIIVWWVCEHLFFKLTMKINKWKMVKTITKI